MSVKMRWSGVTTILKIIIIGHAYAHWRIFNLAAVKQKPRKMVTVQLKNDFQFSKKKISSFHSTHSQFNFD